MISRHVFSDSTTDADSGPGHKNKTGQDLVLYQLECRRKLTDLVGQYPLLRRFGVQYLRGSNSNCAVLPMPVGEAN
jgi:hypothetical protein